MINRLTPIARRGLLLGAAFAFAFLMHAAWSSGADIIAYGSLAAFAAVMVVCVRVG